MLILSRKCGESLMIGDQIELKVIEVSADRVKIGIEAPSQVKILRKELFQTMENNIQAAGKIKKDEFLKFLHGLGEK